MKRFFLLVALSISVCFGNDSVRTRVTVTTQPAGATVFVDGVNRGAAPAMFFNLSQGRHHVRYELSGYETYDEFIDLTNESVIDKTVSLRPITGLLLLKTVPEGCNIKVNGMSIGETPRLITDLPIRDTHRITLSKAGYVEQTISVRFNGREPLVREEKLILDSGVVDFVTDPAGAEVMVNGSVRGVTPLTVKGIPKGSAVVRFKLDGYADEVREIRLNAGDHQTLSVPLQGLPGTLHLMSDPVGAFFYVNDEAHGVGPVMLKSLKPGTYAVRCEKEGYAPQTKYITLGNGKSVREEFRLSNVMGRIEIRTNPPGAEVLLDGKKVGTTRAAAGQDAEVSDVFSVENVGEGEHSIVIRKSGYHDIARSVSVASRETSRLLNLTMKRAFIPNVEVTTTTEVIRGVFKSQTDSMILIERQPGMDYPIPRQFVRKVEFLTK